MKKPSKGGVESREHAAKWATEPQRANSMRVDGDCGQIASFGAKSATDDLHFMKVLNGIQLQIRSMLKKVRQRCAQIL